MKEFEGKVAVVLGATSGIGKVVAARLAADGAVVAVVGRNAQRGEAVVADLATNGAKAKFFSCDITSEASIKKLMDDTVKELGRIDILIGNAGIPEKRIPLAKMTDADFKEFMEVINTDLVGIIQTTRFGLLAMLKNPGPDRGIIVNMASILGVVGDYNTSSYPASKAGVINFTRSQAVTYIKDGVRMNTVAPGYVNTPLLQQLPADDVKSMVDKHPIGRFAEPEEIAEAVAFLCSKKSSFIVGHTLVVDGGYTII